MMDSKFNKPLIRIIDDDSAVHSSWSFLLSGENYECAEYSAAGTLLASADLRRPGCILLDVRMPSMSGLELQNKLKDIGCDLPIVFVSGHGDIDMAVNAVKNGAFDFIEKPPKESRLIDTIEAAVARNKAMRRDQAEVADFKSRLEQLTQREREVIRMVAQGYSNKEVAAEFGISEKTVQVHRGSAYRKLDLHNAAEIARLLLLSGDPL